MSKEVKDKRWNRADDQINWDLVGSGSDIVLCTNDCPFYKQTVRNSGKRGRSRQAPDSGRCTAISGNSTVFSDSSACLSPESRG